VTKIFHHEGGGGTPFYRQPLRIWCEECERCLLFPNLRGRGRKDAHRRPRSKRQGEEGELPQSLIVRKCNKKERKERYAVRTTHGMQEGFTDYTTQRLTAVRERMM